MNFGHGYKPSKYGAKKIIYNGEVFHYSCHFEFEEE